ncbi:hypothetical protein PIROE2DRAFT_16063 [Piromyces sp. E2]|nr:hypothetical protein PIROE2DRAFT_16063 [Piromyces sp. E2]|eukprot:OUM58609.1 hypothetical protein PIROE2DRAFT_16063 [Piromyces sp. E2]
MDNNFKSNNNEDQINNENETFLTDTMINESNNHDEEKHTGDTENNNSPNFSIIKSCLINNEDNVSFNEGDKNENKNDQEENNDANNNDSNNMKDNHSEQPQEMAISPIINFDDKSNPNGIGNISTPWISSNVNKEGESCNDIPVQTTQNILDRNSISDDDTNLMDSVDSKVFDEIFPFDFCQYQSNIGNSKINDVTTNNTYNMINNCNNDGSNDTTHQTKLSLLDFNNGMNSIQNKKLLNEYILSPPTTMTYPMYNENSIITNNSNNTHFIPIHLNDKDMNSDYIIPNSLSITPLNHVSYSDFSFNNNNNSNNGINTSYSIENSYPLNNLGMNNPLTLDSNSTIIGNPILWNINTPSNPNNNLKLLNNFNCLSHNPDESCFASNLTLNQNPIVNDNISNIMKNNSNNSN